MKVPACRAAAFDWSSCSTMVQGTCRAFADLVWASACFFSSSVLILEGQVLKAAKFTVVTLHPAGQFPTVVKGWAS